MRLMIALWRWLIAFWHRLKSPCLFGHARDLQYDRKKGVAVWRCPRCHETWPRVTGQPTKQQRQRPVLKAQLERRPKVVGGRFQ